MTHQFALSYGLWIRGGKAWQRKARHACGKSKGTQRQPRGEGLCMNGEGGRGRGRGRHLCQCKRAKCTGTGEFRAPPSPAPPAPSTPCNWDSEPRQKSPLAQWEGRGEEKGVEPGRGAGRTPPCRRRRPRCSPGGSARTPTRTTLHHTFYLPVPRAAKMKGAAEMKGA